MSKVPELHGNVQTVRAVVTTRWKGTAYRPLVIDSLENYYVDTALDNDADTWTCTFGDPNGDYMPLLAMNNEVRVQLFGIGPKLGYIVTGIADDVDYDDGSWTLTGRDLSSLATDSYPFAQRWAKARAWAIVKQQANDIGFKHTELQHTGMVKKLEYTDGSESYWEFWYRLFRQEKMWLWTTPDGILVGSTLNYNHDPTYFLGDTLPDDSKAIQARNIPIISASLTKTTQNRVEEVVVYGTKGKDGFNVVVKDPTLHQWMKKPRKILLDTKSRTVQAAKRQGWEEIFEGKVGSREFKITIPDPGFTIQQDQVARLVINDIGLKGNYFVVGVRIAGGQDGFIQEVRLRDLGMAVSKRVPAAPKASKGAPKGGSIGNDVEQATGAPKHWGDYFVNAAKKYHGQVDYELFLACLLGICHVETGFINERENGGPGGDHHIWTPFKPTSQKNVPLPEPPPGIYTPPWLDPNLKYTVTNDKEAWERKFANEPGVFGISREFGVGPMQLTSIGLKHSADDLMRAGFRNQYSGGRWHPEWNIMIAARTLANNCQYFHVTRDVDVWKAVDAYNLGQGGAQAYFNANGRVSAYAEKVRKAVNSDPGYLAQIQQADQTNAQQNKANMYTNPFPDGWEPNRLDMGYDGTFRRRIVAPFSGTITFAGLLTGWKGSHGVVIKCDHNIALQSKSLYFYEGVKPNVQAGDKVKTGAVIALPMKNPYNGVMGNIEWGVAQDRAVGQQSDAYVQHTSQNRKDVVLGFLDWAQNVLKVPGKPTSTSGAGYP